MAQLTDILVGSTLPLHPRFGKNLRLSLQLIQGERVLEETRAVAGDENGIWEIGSPLNLPDINQSLTLAVVANTKDGKRRLVSATLRVPDLCARLKAAPNEYYEFATCDSCAALQIVLSCFIKPITSITVETPLLDPLSEAVPDGSNILFRIVDSGSGALTTSRGQRELLEIAYAQTVEFPESEETINILGTIGRAWRALYNDSQVATDLDRAISIQRETVNFGYFHPRLAQHLDYLSSILRARYDYGGNRADIDEAIQASQNALSLTQRDAPETAGLLMRLASNHGSRFNRLGDVADIDMAVSNYSEAVALMHEESPKKAMGCNNFSRALLQRFERLGVREDLDRAILNLENGIGLTPDGDPIKPPLYQNLGIALQHRFERLGDLTDLEMTITNVENALRLTSDGHSDKPARYSNLGGSLLLRFERLGDLADLERAIFNRENAVRLTPDGHLDRPSHYSNLGNVFQVRFKRLGDLADLERAITNQESALRLAPDGHPHKPLAYCNLGAALQFRFQHLGDLADVEMGITNLENAVRLTPEEHPDKPSRYSNLGCALLNRFERLGALSDIEMAITNMECAMRLTPDGHPDKPSRYTNLGNVLRCKFQRLGDLTDLEMAITNMENAVRLMPDGHPGKPLHHNNLGNVLQHRFKRLDDLTALERAITNLESALRLTPDGHPDKPSRHCNLGNALQLRFERLGDLADLERAISNKENGVRLESDSRPEKVMMTTNLAICYECRFISSGNRSDLELAHSLYATAAQSPAGRPQRRFKAAMKWSFYAKIMNNSPLPAFECAIDQLLRVAWFGIPVSEQHSLLERIGGAVLEAVAAAVEAEEYELAVEWMEQGRSIVWRNLLKLRTPLDDLRAVHPKLAAQLHSISQQLDAPDSREFTPQTSFDRPQQDVVKSHTRLAIEWDEVVNEIKKLPNFDTFLKPIGFDHLVPAAREGPVVILNVSGGRCDALALIPGSNGGSSLVPIPLKSFSLKQGEKLLLKLTTLLQQVGVRDGETRKPTQMPRNMDTQIEFKSVLYTLWVAVVKPVLDGLAYQPQSKDLPRIWWCATGPLALLPIHAAGDYDATELGQKVSDYVVSSYTPTLTAILDSSYPILSNDFKLLLVAQPNAPNYTAIPKTMDEVKRIEKIAGGVDTISLTKENASVKRVQMVMKASHWVHLACHGKQDASKPIESGIILYDGTLKLSTIIKEPLPNADFVFLSACQTATGDQKVAEESVHLAAGMLLAGYRGVIATMWSIKDDDGPRVAEVVYSRMLKDGKPNRREAAYALHDAVKELRDSGADFTSWVPFIHIGR